MKTNKWQRRAIVLVALVVLVLVGAACLRDDVQQMGVTNFSSLHLSDANATATPLFMANQTGTGRILELRDASTPVFTVDDGGAWSATGAGTFSGGVDLNGGTLTIDADADTTVVEASDDVISLTSGAAAGYWNILTGNFKVGNGTPGVSLNGEDAYIEGTLEVDSSITADGGLDLNGATLTIDADADSTLLSSTDDVISFTIGAAAGRLDLLVGNISVGNGSPDTALDGEDLYVEGGLEVDGVTNFDGTSDFASTVTVNGNITYGGLEIHSNNIFTPTAGQTLTPVDTFYRIGSTAAISMVLAACSNNGQIVATYGKDNNTVTINDTNIRTTDGAAATIGQYDIIYWVCSGTEWIHMLKSANS
jgi:hypothetical protein